MQDNVRLQILSQLGGQNQQAHQPGLGDQILAGGAGMYGMHAAQTAQQGLNKPAGGGGIGSMPQGGDPLNQLWRTQLMGVR